jgi:hypothetical protein
MILAEVGAITYYHTQCVPPISIAVLLFAPIAVSGIPSQSRRGTRPSVVPVAVSQFKLTCIIPDSQKRIHCIRQNPFRGGHMLGSEAHNLAGG